MPPWCIYFHPMDRLTTKQLRVLNYLRQYQRDNGMPPTRAEIARDLGFASPNAAQQHLATLARKGAIELTGGRSRGIRVPEPAEPAITPIEPLRADDLLDLPVVGRVAAGAPLLAVENFESTHTLSPRLFSRRPDYLLRVVGESMRDAGIWDGDLLAVAKTAEARDGQIIVARVDDEVTVKRFVRRGQTVVLEPANPDFDPIEVDLATEALAVEGIACGVIRGIG